MAIAGGSNNVAGNGWRPTINDTADAGSAGPLAVHFEFGTEQHQRLSLDRSVIDPSVIASSLIPVPGFVESCASPAWLETPPPPRDQPAGRILSPALITDPRRLIEEAAHDVRSPIATAHQIVSTVTGRMRRNQALSGEELGMLDLANQQLLQASNWAEGILLQRNLEVSRPVVIRNRFYPPQLQNLVKPLLDSLANLRDVQLNWDGWDRSLPRLYTDANHLSRVIMNLGTNAIKASQPGQSVGIIVNGQGKTGKRLIIDIRDQGQGLSPETLRTLNQPEPRGYATDESPNPRTLRWLRDSDAQPHSTGLGLAVSKSLMLGLGGALSASSREGVGTTMRISLPVDDPACLINSWLHLSVAVPKAEMQKLRRVQIHAVRMRGLNLQFGDRELQQFAGEQDFIYRVASDRWIWLTLVDQFPAANLRIQGFSARLNKLANGDHTSCRIEQVFQSRVFSPSSLHSGDHNQLPFLLNSISSKVQQLIGGHVPKIDDLQAIENVILSRPVAKNRVQRIVRTDGAAHLGSHLSESRGVHPNKGSTDSLTGHGRDLTKVLGEIAQDWHSTQAKLDQSIRRVDAPIPVYPTAKYVKSVGVGR